MAITDNESARYEMRNQDFSFRDQGADGKVHLGCSAHIHYSIEFFLLTSGEVDANIDSSEYHLNSGDFCIAFPNQIHSYTSFGDEGYMLCIVNPDVMPELADVFSQQVPECAVVRGKELPPSVPEIMKQMRDMSRRSSEYKDVVIKGLLLSLFGEVLPHLQLTDVRSVSSHALKTVVNYCSRNFSRDLSLGILEEELHISKYYISHLFSMKLKIRFNDYINSLRISDACRQLRQTDKTITEISECVGFNTLRTFNRAFIRQVGMSPSEYRRLKPQTSRSVSMIG